MVSTVTRFWSWLTGTTMPTSLTSPSSSNDATSKATDLTISVDDFDVGPEVCSAASLKVVRAWRGDDVFKTGRLLVHLPPQSLPNMHMITYKDRIGTIEIAWYITSQDIYQCIMDTNIEAIWNPKFYRNMQVADNLSVREYLQKRVLI